MIRGRFARVALRCPAGGRHGSFLADNQGAGPDSVEHWPLDRLRPYGRNPRTHSDEQIAQIAASIIEFGWTNPVLIAGDGTVIAGHGRLDAARRLQARRGAGVDPRSSLGTPRELELA
jgi:hypothetical protein